MSLKFCVELFISNLKHGKTLEFIQKFSVWKWNSTSICIWNGKFKLIQYTKRMLKIAIKVCDVIKASQKISQSIGALPTWLI